MTNRRQLLEAVRALPPRLREVVEYRYFLSLSEAETALALGVPNGTVKSRSARAMERLRLRRQDRPMTDPTDPSKRRSGTCPRASSGRLPLTSAPASVWNPRRPTWRPGVAWRPRVAWAVALVGLALAILLVPPARQAVANLLEVAGIRFEFGDVPDLPVPTHLAPGVQVDLESARGAVDFPILVPSVLGPPPRCIFCNGSLGTQVFLAWEASDRSAGGRGQRHGIACWPNSGQISTRTSSTRSFREGRRSIG